MSKNRVTRIAELGQIVWLDNLDLPMIQKGQLARLIRDRTVPSLSPVTAAISSYES